MASCDYIKSVQSSLQALPAAASLLEPQHEKISCSFTSDRLLDPLLLVGLSVKLWHPYPYGPIDPDGSWRRIYTAVVCGVQVGSVALGIQSQLILKVEDCLALEFCPCSEVTVISVSK